MTLVLAREVADLDSILGQLGQPEQTLLKLFGLFGALVELLELLPVVDFVLKTALHDLLSHFFDTLDEERFELIPLSAHVDLLGDHFLGVSLLTVNDCLQVTNSISVTGLQRLHILDDLLLNITCGHV